MRFVFEVQVLEPEIAVAILVFLGGIIAAVITAIATVRAARIQASHQHPTELPPPPPKQRRRRRRPGSNARSP